MRPILEWHLTVSFICKKKVSFSCYGMLKLMVNDNKVNDNYLYRMVASSVISMDVDLSHKIPSLEGPGNPILKMLYVHC